MRRICASAAAAGLVLGAGVAMASNDAAAAAQGGLLGLKAPAPAEFPADAWGFARPDPEFRPDIVVAAAPPGEAPPAAAPKSAGGVGSGAAGQPESAGPNPNENAAAAEQAGPEAPPKPSILRSIVSDWKGELKFGFELSSGNNDRTRFRGGFNINKSYWGHKTQLQTEYIIANNNRGESENRLVSRLVQNWSTGGEKWSGVFLRVDGDADRFQDYDYRLNLSSGANYQAFKDDETDILFRLGGSARREFNSPNDDIVPEGAFFLNATHRISDTQRVRLQVDYLPEIEQPSRYRINTRANWDIDINPEAGLGLRLAINNRYDARPSRRPERNDFDMSVFLIWNF
ncbi:MAG: DUF481 domain-containing protein [Planctomycetota bacterium]